MKTLKLLLIFLLFPLFCSSQQCRYAEKCRYAFIGVKYDLINIKCFDVGELASNGYYNGIQGAIPVFGAKTFIMNTKFGYGIKTQKIPGVIGNVIIGLYSKDFLETVNINYGIGLTIFSNGISFGIDYTNMEHIGIKAGIVL